jgi:hypothetical protein
MTTDERSVFYSDTCVPLKHGNVELWSQIFQLWGKSSRRTVLAMGKYDMGGICKRIVARRLYWMTCEYSLHS